MFQNCLICESYKQVNRIHLCSSCFEEDEKILQTAKEKLNEEGKKSIFDLADELMIAPKRIFLWIDQHRIKGNLFRHECPICQQDLLNGFCECQKMTLAEEAKAMNEVLCPERFHSTLRVEKLRRDYWERSSTIRKRQKRDIWFYT